VELEGVLDQCRHERRVDVRPWAAMEQTSDHHSGAVIGK
jgi:hypothetical protein